MARKPCFALPDFYLHITQSGNYRQRTFHTDRDRIVFDLIAHHAEARQVDVLGFCLMSNQLQLIARFSHEGSTSRFMLS